jgi:MFS family permease
MTIQRADLEAAAAAGILRHEQIDRLLGFLHQRDSKAGKARFGGTHILYYLGGLLAIGAATLFATLAVDALGMGALFALSVVYALCCVGIAIWFERRALGVPAGIFATLAIALVPLAVFALQHLLGFWADGRHAQHYRDYHYWIDWRWLIMELSTLAVGAVMLWRFRYTFLVMPIALTLWYMGMDIVPALIMRAHGGTDAFYSAAAWELRKQISLVFGLIMTLIAFFVDLRSRHSKDYAFWLYLFGVMTFWGALSSMGSGQLSGKLVYLAINFLMIFVAAVLGRRVFAVFGGIGVVLTLGDLSWGMFKNSFGFVAVLTLLGFALIGAGIWWSKHEAAISAKVRAFLPRDLRELLEARTG